MAKTIAVIGTIDNIKVQKFISTEVSLFINETICFKEVLNKANSYIGPIEGKISAEQINDYVRALANTNIDLKYNIGIISNFELLSVANQNKLLKTIEDSAANTIQIIICRSEQKLLSTIKSRVIVIDMRNEVLNYECLEKEEEFYQNIIKNHAELNYIRDNLEEKNTLFAIFNYCKNNDYKRAYILYTTMFQDYNKLLNGLILRIILYTLYSLKQYQVMKTMIEYEQRMFYNLNERLQIEAMFVEIIKENNE